MVRMGALTNITIIPTLFGSANGNEMEREKAAIEANL